MAARAAPGRRLSCEECRPLGTHRFRSPDDLVHAAQVAAQEVDRGVLERIAVPVRSAVEDEALGSMRVSEALPATLAYRFRCRLCADEFTLEGDVRAGTGAWTRHEAGAAPD